MPGFNIGTSLPSSINPKREFHRNHRWIIEDLGIPGGGPQPEERLYAQSIQLPSLTFDEEKIKSGASIEYKIAKKANWQDFTIKFYDVHGLYEHYRKWQDKIWNEKEGIGLASAYKGRVILSLTDGEGEIKQTYIAIGAYPKSITHGDLSYTSSDVKLLTVAYSYDFARIILKDTKGGQVTGGPANQNDVFQREVNDSRRNFARANNSARANIFDAVQADFRAGEAAEDSSGF